MKIYLNDYLIADNCNIAQNFLEKLLGLFSQSTPLLLKNCNSVHTFFMKNNIDAIFLDKNSKVIKLSENLSPNNVILPIKNAFFVLENNSSFIKSAKIKIGDTLVFKE